MSGHTYGNKKKPYFYIINANADEEITQELPCNTKYIFIRPQSLTDVRISFYENGTSDAEREYFTAPRGNAYDLDGINFTGHTLYLRPTKATSLEVFVLT